MKTILFILDKSYFGNRVMDYGQVLILCLIGFLLIEIVRRILLKKVKILSEQTETKIDDFMIDLVTRIAVPLSYVAISFVAIDMLILPDALDNVIKVMVKFVIVIALLLVGVRFLDYATQSFLKSSSFEENSRKSMYGMVRVFKILIWGIAIIAFLDNIGFKVTGIIAGLGIGGVAVAMAAQAVLKDLFSYFAIVFDRPFVIGDFIIVDDKLGTVEHIGIKTTCISSLSGEQIIFSNSDLTDSRVHNYKRMYKRRVVFSLGLTYETSAEKLTKTPQLIEDIITKIDDVQFDRAHFKSYGDFSLNFEVVYYVLGNDYTKYMNIQQDINLSIYRVFEEKGIIFAYPTQTVHFKNDDEGTV